MFWDIWTRWIRCHFLDRQLFWKYFLLGCGSDSQRMPNISEALVKSFLAGESVTCGRRKGKLAVLVGILSPGVERCRKLQVLGSIQGFYYVLMIGKWWHARFSLSKCRQWKQWHTRKFSTTQTMTISDGSWQSVQVISGRIYGACHGQAFWGDRWAPNMYG